MGNPWTGEVALTIDHEPRVLKLTLGALAELEQELESGSLVELVQRFEASEFSGRDILAVVSAGLSGGGHPMERAQLMQADIRGGPMAAARAAAQVLARAFMVPGEA